MVSVQREVAGAGDRHRKLETTISWVVNTERPTLQATKGLPLIMLIRASPFPPWVYSNTLFAVSHTDCCDVDVC